MAPDDSTAFHWIDRRDYLKLGGGLAAGGSLWLAGCTSETTPADGSEDRSGGDPDDGSTSTGYLSTSVTDQPNDIGDFESCVVTLDGVWLGPRRDQGDEAADDGGDEDDGEDEEDEETDEESEQSTNQSTSGSSAAGSQPEDEPGNGQGDGNGRTYYAFDEPQEADLVELQGDETQLIDDREVPVGTYQFLQLDVAGVEGILVDGGEATVETPGNAPLKFQESFDVREDYRTSFTADFAPVSRGTGEYQIRPVASGTEVTYEPVDGE